MSTFEVSGQRVAQCPISRMMPLHYIGPYSDPCRCYEIENALAVTSPQHGPVIELGIRPRYIKVFDKHRLYDTHDVLAMDFEELSTLRGLDKTGLVVLIYKMAHHGIEIPEVVKMSPTTMLRMSWQVIWEGLGQ